MNFISALFAVALLSKADGVSWQPRTPLSGAVMRDFVNSRALPTTSLHGPQAGAGAGGGGTSSISAKSANGITEDVARGGHASIKTRGDEDEEQRDDGANDTHAETDVAPTVRQEVDEPSFEAVNLDVKVGKEAKEARRRASSAAKIAKKLKVRLDLEFLISTRTFICVYVSHSLLFPFFCFPFLSFRTVTTPTFVEK